MPTVPFIEWVCQLVDEVLARQVAMDYLLAREAEAAKNQPKSVHF